MNERDDAREVAGGEPSDPERRPADGPSAESGARADEVDQAGDDRTSDTAAGDDATGRADDASSRSRAAVLADESLGQSRRLDGRVRYQWLAGLAVGAAVSGVVVALAVQFLVVRAGLETGGLPFGFARRAVLAGLVAVVALLGLAVFRAVLLYRSWRYEVREDSLYLTRGVLTRVQTVAPYVRVQHIDTRRSPVERLLGLSSLVVYTAGSRGADVTVPGLTDERAAELQTRLKRLAIASEEEDAV